MRDLNKIVDEYLSTPTDYAVQIVGNWGHGKTYYYKKHIENLIKNKEIYSDAKKKYKPIYISLFGLKSTEDIATKIVIEFYESKFFKNYFKSNTGKKTLSITEGIFKIGFRGFLAFNRLGNVDEYTTDIKNIGKGVLATDELVLCFDDLERRDSALNIKDLTGYINSLLDEKVKVLLISNEDVLKKNEDDYKNLKEKIIGISIDYSVNIKLTIEEIIKTKFSSSIEFQKFLNENIDLIIEISKSVDNNFRHIIYSLNILHYFFSEFRKNIFDIQHEISEKLNEEFKNISRIILAFAIEFKASNVSYKDLKFYNNHLQLFSIEPFSDRGLTIEENKISPLSLFIEKYKINRNQYLFYKSIFEYVTFKDEFILEEFINDFKDKFHLNNGQILPQYELLNELLLENYFNFSDEECLLKYKKVIEFAASGNYKADDYFSVMFLVQRFEEIFDVDLENAYNKLVEGLKKSIQNTGSNYEVEFDHFKGKGNSIKYSEHQNQLSDIGLNEIKLYEGRVQQKRLNEIIDLFTSDFKVFQHKLRIEKYFENEILEFSFFNNISGQGFIALIKQNDNELLIFLKNLFKRRYTNKEQFEKESFSLSTYFKLLNEYSAELRETKGNKIRKFIIDELISALSEIRAKFENNQNNQVLKFENESD